MRLRRIHIVGGPGSGKTHLAKELGKELGIEVHDLDDIKWRGDGYDHQRPLTERKQMLDAILKKKEWINEGVYGHWVEQSFRAADRIIILKPRQCLRSWRITKRFLRGKLGLEKSKKKETWKNFKELYRWSRTYYKKEFARIEEQLKPYEHKTIVVTRARCTTRDILEE